MKIIVKIVFVFFTLLFFAYILSPDSGFPPPPQGVLISSEPADVETNLRRGYYTDLRRDDVISHYQSGFKNVSLFGINSPSIRLNYPPEEAKVLIRDQTRSTYLEEIVHPLRESIFINGFEPKLDKDRILIDGNFWESKVIVRYVPSNPALRLMLGLASVVLILLLARLWNIAIEDLKKEVSRKR